MPLPQDGDGSGAVATAVAPQLPIYVAQPSSKKPESKFQRRAHWKIKYPQYMFRKLSDKEEVFDSLCFYNRMNYSNSIG